MKAKFVHKRFNAAAAQMIEHCNNIIEEYQQAGYTLTLRQVYYQLVSRALIPNRDKEYQKLGALVNDARLAGLIDWDAIEDRGRYLRQHSHWDGPADIVDACSKQFRVDMWENQAYRPEIWVEKDALVGVIGVPGARLDVPYFSCRGYTSVTALYETAVRLRRFQKNGQTPVIIHLGDHDPSGIDMTRDIKDRLKIFGLDLEVNRVALNMPQVEEYGPPPNPAKVSDSRYKAYLLEYGDESWELDALEPRVLDEVITSVIERLIDKKKWKAQERRQEESRERLVQTAEELRA